MTEQECIDLMKSSKNSNEWNANCLKVKKEHNNDYPRYWWPTFIASGLMNRILNDPTADQIKIKAGDGMVQDVIHDLWGNIKKNR